MAGFPKVSGLDQIQLVTATGPVVPKTELTYPHPALGKDAAFTLGICNTVTVMVTAAPVLGTHLYVIACEAKPAFKSVRV